MTTELIIAGIAVAISLAAIIIAADTPRAEEQDDVTARVQLLERQVNVLIDDTRKIDDAVNGTIRLLSWKHESDAEWTARVGDALTRMIDAIQLATAEIRCDMDLLDLHVRGEQAMNGFDDPRRD